MVDGLPSCGQEGPLARVAYDLAQLQDAAAPAHHLSVDLARPEERRRHLVASAVDPFTGAVVPVVAGVSASSGSTSGTSRPLSASSATPSSASATAGSADFSTESADTATGGIAATLPPVKVARIMPLPLPGSDPRFDRLATLALGGLMFLGVRALMRRSGLISA